MGYLEDKVSMELRRGAVARAIFCPVNGAVLDVRTAVMVESANGLRLLAVMSPEGWALRGDAILSAMPDVIVTNAPTVASQD